MAGGQAPLPLALPAIWFDGTNARAWPCELDWQDGELILRVAQDQPRRYARAQVGWPERTRHGARQVRLPDGGVVSVNDARAWDDWAQAAGLLQPWAVRWALSWRAVAVALALLLACLFAAWRWGIPWGAQQAVQWVPDRLQTNLGQRVMQDLEQRQWLAPSELKPEVRARIEDSVAGMVKKAYRDDAPPHQLHFRKAPKWLGPNAFALPGGDIVITDALVVLLQSAGDTVNPALLGVVAHELGHVRERHGLRLVFEAGAITVLTGWWLGDFSSILSAAPALAAQAGYSRDHERSADLEARRVMRAADIDPAAMVTFFQALNRAVPGRDGDNLAFGLATHPVDSERIRFFQETER
jgi:predicted Zn-dependent protease